MVAYGFGATFGTNASDIITSSVTIAAAAGSISGLIRPNWNSGDSGDHRFWNGTSGGDAASFIKFSDNNIYAGFSTRIIIADTGLFTSGTWANWVLTWTNAGTHFLYNNGTQVGSSVSSGSDGDGTFRIGNVSANPADGLMAEIGYWNVQLDAGEAAALGQFYSPALIRPASLVFYAPLVRNLVDVRGGNTPSNSGAVVQRHSRIIYPKRRAA